MVTTFYPPWSFGGDGIYVQRLTRALARRGHQVTVVHSRDAYDALGGRESAAPEAETGVTLHALARARPRTAALLSYLSGRPALYGSELRAVLDAREYDVVHFHNVSLVGGPRVLSYGGGVKLYTTHEHWLVCPMHVLFRDNREPCVEPHCLRCTLRFRRPPQLWRYGSLLDRSLPEVDLFLAPSRFTIDAHHARGIAQQMLRLPLFVPDDEIGAARDVQTARPYFLFVGRLERLKGVDVLLDVFRTFRDADLVIAGEGSHESLLRRRAAGLPHVRFAGRVAAGELDALYAGARALVIPSIGYETFGIVGVEAMARRTPVIVNDLGALPELVDDSGGGLVYRTPAELVDALRRLLAEPELHSLLGERGHAAWRKLWSEDVHVAAYLDAIETAKASRG